MALKGPGFINSKKNVTQQFLCGEILNRSCFNSLIIIEYLQSSIDHCSIRKCFDIEDYMIGL